MMLILIISLMDPTFSKNLFDVGPNQNTTVVLKVIHKWPIQIMKENGVLKITIGVVY